MSTGGIWRQEVSLQGTMALVFLSPGKGEQDQGLWFHDPHATDKLYASSERKELLLSVLKMRQNLLGTITTGSNLLSTHNEPTEQRAVIF